MIDTPKFNSHLVIGYLNYQWFYISPDRFPGAYNFFTKAKELSQNSSYIHAVFSTKDLTKPLALYYRGFQYNISKDE